MDNKDSNSLLAAILSAIAGLGLIVAALSPLFSDTAITKMFIDNGAVGFLALVAFIVSTINLWIFGSRTTGLAFTNTINFQLLARVRIVFAVLFAVAVIAFYGIKLLFSSHHISLGVGSFTQSIFYLFSFFFLSAMIGLQYRDTYEQYKWKKNEENKTININQLLISSGHVHVDLKIMAIATYQFDPTQHPQNWQNSISVIFAVNKGRDQFQAIIDQNIKNILAIGPWNPIQTQPLEAQSSENPTQ